MTNETTLQPFLIEHRRLDQEHGHFTPEARLCLTPALRTSRLLAALSDEQARTLLCLLTFLSPNGSVQATTPDVAQALALPPGEAHTRLEHLAAFAWNKAPVVHEVRRETGLPVYVLSGCLIGNEQAPDSKEEAPAVEAAGKEAVIEHSRRTYAVPRQEAEAAVAAQLGVSPEESADTPQGEARRRLLALGVSREEVEHLVDSYPVEDILLQLNWLPERSPRNPARLIVAAIEENYEAPASTVHLTGTEEPEPHDETVRLSIPDQPTEGTDGA